MSEVVDKLRDTINARREELQKLKNERSAVADQAAEVRNIELLARELASVEQEIKNEQELLAEQRSVVAKMQDAVSAQDSEPEEKTEEVHIELPENIVPPKEVPEVTVVPANDEQ